MHNSRNGSVLSKDKHLKFKIHSTVELMLIVFKGIQLGIVLAFLVGPVFFTIIQTSVEKGFWNGALVAMGVSLSDILYVAICYFGLFQFLNDPGSKKNMAYAGGAILIGFGLYHLIVK